MNTSNSLNCEYCNRIGNPADYKRLHSHTVDEISLIIQGDIRYISDNVTDRIKGRSLIFSKAYQLHNPYVEQNHPYERYQISFPHRMINNELAEDIDVASFILPLEDRDFEEILGYMSTLYQDRDCTDKLTQEKQKFILNALYIKISQLYLKSNHTPANITKSYIASVMDYINSNSQEKLTIESIASRFYVSRTKLVKDFSQRTGMTILQHINLARIKKAKEYLAKGYSVTHTADMCGFANSGHFIKVFSGMNGITPLKYKQKT